MQKNAFIESAGPDAFSCPEHNRGLLRIFPVVLCLMIRNDFFGGEASVFKCGTSRELVGIESVEIASSRQAIG